MKKRFCYILRSGIVSAAAALLLLSGCASAMPQTKAAGATAAVQGEMRAMEKEVSDMEMSPPPEDASPDVIPQPEGLTSSNTPADVADTSRKLIRTVEITAETTDFDGLLTMITGKVPELGGYVENSEIQGRQSYAGGDAAPQTAYIKIRVPSQKLADLVSQVESGSNVIFKGEAASDITLQYADLESRKKSLLVEQERIFALLEKADSLEVILSLESHLTDIRYQLESMESQLRLFDNQVNYSTLNLSIQEVLELTPDPQMPASTVSARIRNGFEKSMKSVTDGFTDLLVALIANLPYLIVCFVVLGIGFLIYRKNKRRHHPAAPKEPEDNTPKQD